MRQRGFTLVELLVVIVVLGLLIALAMPTLFNALDRSKRNVFSDQLKIFSTKVLNRYSDNKMLEGAGTPICYGIDGIKEEKTYKGYVIISPEDNKVGTVHIYNKEFAYQGPVTDLIGKGGEAISKLTQEEHATQKNEIESYFSNPDNGCVEYYYKK